MYYFGRTISTSKEKETYIGKYGTNKEFERNIFKYAFLSINSAYWGAFHGLLMDSIDNHCDIVEYDRDFNYVKTYKFGDKIYTQFQTVLSFIQCKSSFDITKHIRKTNIVLNSMIEKNNDCYLLKDDELYQYIMEFKEPTIIDERIILLSDENDIAMAKLYSNNNLLKLKYINES